MKICSLDVSMVRMRRPIANSAVNPAIYRIFSVVPRALLSTPIAAVGSKQATTVVIPEVIFSAVLSA
jgi:hypothetical protein